MIIRGEGVSDFDEEGEKYSLKFALSCEGDPLKGTRVVREDVREGVGSGGGG